MVSEQQTPTLDERDRASGEFVNKPQMSARLLRWLFAGMSCGRLTVVTPGGDRVVCTSDGPGPDAVAIIHRWRTLRRLLVGGDVAFAEAYLDGDWSSPDIAALIQLFASNDETIRRTVSGFVPARLINRLQHVLKRNSRAGSRRNIMDHYDLGNAFYAQWLDRGMTYSSALYARPDLTLEEAQTAKQDTVLDALALKGGERVLEIGCGWGGLAERLARRGCEVVGVTLSPAQLDYARARLAAAGLTGRVDLRLQDYRDVTGQFDRIVSIEMIEAVGREYWPMFFQCMRDRLTKGGSAVIQAITIADHLFPFYARSPDFIQRHIFPGGMLLPPSAIRDEARSAELHLANSMTFGSSYARTLSEWQTRFQHAWPRIQPLGFDGRFRKLWEYYLAYCEGGFRSGAIDVGLYVLKG